MRTINTHTCQGKIKCGINYQHLPAGAANIHEMARAIGGSDRKDLIRDYSLNEEQQKFKDRVVFYRESTIRIGEALALKRDLEINGGLEGGRGGGHNSRLSADHPLTREIQALVDTRRGHALEILQDFPSLLEYSLLEPHP